MGCRGGTLQAGWSPLPQEEHSGAKLTSSPGAWRYWFYFQQVPKRSGDATSLQPSPAQLGTVARTLPRSPRSLQKPGTVPMAPLGCPGREQA